MTDTLRERIMRIIGGFVLYDDKGGPDTEVLYDRLTYGKADEQLAELTDQIMALLPSRPAGWEQALAGLDAHIAASARYVGFVNWISRRELIEWRTMLAALATPPTEPLETER